MPATSARRSSAATRSGSLVVRIGMGGSMRSATTGGPPLGTYAVLVIAAMFATQNWTEANRPRWDHKEWVT